MLDTRPPHRVDVEWADVDVMDQDALTAAVAGTEAIFHLAAMADVNDIFEAPVDSVALNTVGTVRVLEAHDGPTPAASSSPRRSGSTAPRRSPSSTRTRRSSPTPTATSTSSPKIASEMMCRDYHTLYGRPFTVLRYGIPYGPRMRDNCVAAAFFRRAFAGEALTIDGDGLQ